MKIPVLIATVALAGCAHELTLPVYDAAPCAISVSDDRPDPEHMYPTGAPIQVRITPPLSTSLKGAICASETNGSLDGASFVITDFTCTSAGFMTITYVVTMRGLLNKANGADVELRAGNKVDSGGGYVPAGCAEAAQRVIPDLAAQIRNALQ